LLINSEKYATHYLEKPADKYYILDNGAAEKGAIDIIELNSVAQMFEVDEVALPDTINNPELTADKAYDAIPYLENYWDGHIPFNNPCSI
jgi:hypothetical protein